MADPGASRSINPKGLAQFFTFGQLMGEDTLLSDVTILPAAGLLAFDAREDRLEVEHYWQLGEGQGGASTNPAEMLDRIDDAFGRAVERRITGAKHYGISLSGGMDSRTILGAIPPGRIPLKTVSLGMEGSIDVLAAQAMSRIAGCELSTYQLDRGFLSHFEEHLSRMVRLTDGHYLGQCITMPTLPLYRELGIDVLLRGHAGELMHMDKAYNFSMDPSAFTLVDERELKSWLFGRMRAFLREETDSPLFTPAYQESIEPMARASLGEVLCSSRYLNEPAQRIAHVFLTQRLRREMSLSMVEFNSVVETRLPFLDNDLVDLLFAMPPERKLGETIQAHILRHRMPAFLGIPNANTGARIGAGRLARTIARTRLKVFGKLGLPGYQPYERLGLWLRQDLRPAGRAAALDRSLSRSRHLPPRGPANGCPGAFERPPQSFLSDHGGDDLRAGSAHADRPDRWIRLVGRVLAPSDPRPDPCDRRGDEPSMSVTSLDPGDATVAGETISTEARPRTGATKPSATSRRTIGLVGAGYIAEYHILALRERESVEIVGVCDPNRPRAEAVRRRWDLPYASDSLANLIRDRRPDVVHILVPPQFHFEVAEQALEAGVHVLLEKPMALRAEECDRLIRLAGANGLRLGVNHNAVYHPLYRRLLDDLAARKLGAIEHVVSFNNLPLAQLEAGDHDHWMFRHPENVLFEQGPHPMSQICGLLGAVRDVSGRGSRDRRLRNGGLFHSAWQFEMECERGPASLYMAFGRPFPEAWLHVLGEDGSVRIDLLNDTYVLDRRTKYIDPVDTVLRPIGQAAQAACGGVRKFVRYGMSTLRLTGRSDAYYEGMRDSIASFYDDFRTDEAQGESARLGGMVIDGLERAAAAHRAHRAATPEPPPARSPEPVASPPAVPATPERDTGEILVLGGTGFIGRRLVRALVEAGHPVRLLARRPALVPALAGGAERLSVVPGDIRDPADVRRAVAGCRTVIHLVAGAPTDWEEHRLLFVEGTRHVAEACLQEGVAQLLFASTIATYNLGRGGAVITESTPLDDRPERRNLYTRAKIACERLLMDLHRTRGLPVTIFRPGVVIGPGSPPEHIGVGQWAGRTQCISWGRGRVPIPFVLVDDVVSAFIAALGRPELAGQSFNLVGDVRLTAREYIAALREVFGRDIQAHYQPIASWMAVDVLKWSIKALARKPDNEFPSYRDLASRSSVSQFDCTRTKQTLGWQPVADRDRFIDLGLRRTAAGDLRA